MALSSSGPCVGQPDGSRIFIANFKPQDYQLLRGGLPWRTLKPLSLLSDEITCIEFNLVFTDINQNPWWDHATLFCRKKTTAVFKKQP